MRRTSDTPVGTVEYLPRRQTRGGWSGLVAGLAIVAIVVGAAKLAGTAATLLLQAAAILLTVAVAAGIVAFAAFRLGAAPFPRPRRVG